MVGNVLTPAHLLMVLVVALLILGPKRLPAAGRGLGEAMRGFKDALTPGERSDTSNGQISDSTPHPSLSSNDEERSHVPPEDASSKSSSPGGASSPAQLPEQVN